MPLLKPFADRWLELSPQKSQKSSRQRHVRPSFASSFEYVNRCADFASNPILRFAEGRIFCSDLIPLGATAIDPPRMVLRAR